MAVELSRVSGSAPQLIRQHYCVLDRTHVFAKQIYKYLSIYRFGTFTVDVQYADAGELQALPKICIYTIGHFQATKAEHAKVKVKVPLNMLGIVCVDSARLIEEEEVEVSVAKEPAKETTKMDMDRAPTDVPTTNETDVNMQDASGAENSRNRRQSYSDGD